MVSNFYRIIRTAHFPSAFQDKTSSEQFLSESAVFGWLHSFPTLSSIYVGVWATVALG